MNRTILSALLAWKNSSRRMPLILRGARQVGKTYSLKTFGAANFRQCHYVNFEEDERIARIFEKDLGPARILDELRFYFNSNIDTAADIVIFDEIQRCGRAITSLKYFCEEMPQLALCAAGSLLGVKLNSASFPVGKVTFLDLFPMTFAEFIEGIGESQLSALLTEHDPHEPYQTLAHERLWELWKQYLVAGGLPAVVSEFGRNRANIFEAVRAVRTMQSDLLNAYLADIAKHSGKTNALHIERLWRNVPVQLARNLDESASKFRFKDAIPGIRGYDRLAGPIDWLQSAHLVIKTTGVEKAALPLSSFGTENIFKLYVYDVGMLGTMAYIKPQVFLEYGFGMYQGYVAENFVAQELLAGGFPNLYFWQGRTSEIEFLAASEKGIVPIEVKSGRVTNSRSLSIYEEKFKPERAYILSARNSGRQEKRFFVPIYAAGVLARLLDSR